MKTIGLIIVLATALTLHGCSSDNNHHSVSNEAVYPADIESLHATYFNEADGSEKQTIDLEISYADDGKIDGQVIISSFGGTAFHTMISQYNGNGDVEQETFRDDMDEETSSSYYSYNTVDDLIERYSIVSPDDLAAPQSVVVTNYSYDIAGNEVTKIVQKTVDNVPVFEDSYTVTSTYDNAGEKVLRVTEYDTNGDGDIDKSTTMSFIYDEDGRLASTLRVRTGIDVYETNEYTYNDDGLIAQRDTTYDDGSDGQLYEKHISAYRYIDNTYPLDSTHTAILYDADENIIAHAVRLITYSYDDDHLLLTYLLEDTDPLNSDQLMNSELWEFSYDEDGRGATTESWIDADGDGDGESYLAVSGVLSMRSADTLTQLYHFPLKDDVYHAVPLSFAIASGLIFE
ncbi:MAG: hypothetical protein BA874_00465 [Desulfuromonadales bacterium C00003068]|jgi:antitoxin component YwqK of YwqJK toxin-antitoxin module|nr:MAG: hypothetical protein BA874_00465 [Desulfuromonadales bacterium C00003068]